jgi:hypothetical protein
MNSSFEEGKRTGDFRPLMQQMLESWVHAHGIYRPYIQAPLVTGAKICFLPIRG